MAAKKRRTLAEAFAETRAVQATRDTAKRRLSRAAREALAPVPPTAAITAYSGVMGSYVERVQRIVERHVLSQLPVLGSGDPLDRTALEQGLYRAQMDLHALAEKMRRNAYAAGRRVSAHSRREVARILNLEVPPATDATLKAFADLNVALLRRVGDAQVARIRKAIAEYPEGASMRKEILDALWVARNRSKLIAKDQPQKLQEMTLESYSRAVGSERYIWCTRQDELVRDGHAALDGKVFRWDQPPNTGHGEGNNNPGQAPACRCRALPVEATYK